MNAITQTCKCSVCERSRGLVAIVDASRTSKAEHGALLDLIADWWALAHPTEETQQKGAKDAKGALA